MSGKFRQTVYFALVVGSVVYYSDVLNLVFKYVSSERTFLNGVFLTLSVNLALIMGSLIFVKVFDFIFRNVGLKGDISAGLLTLANQILVFFVVNLGIFKLHEQVSILGNWQGLFVRHLTASIQVGHVMLMTALVIGSIMLGLVTSLENSIYKTALTEEY